MEYQKCCSSNVDANELLVDICHEMPQLFTFKFRVAVSLPHELMEPLAVMAAFTLTFNNDNWHVHLV